MTIIERPTTLSEKEETSIEQSLTEYRTVLDEHVEGILEDIHQDRVAQQVNVFVFTPNDMLPKGGRRPVVKPIFLLDQLYRAHGNGDPPAELIKFAIVVHEYSDIGDDLLDGDVSPGHELEALLTIQTFVPLMAKYANALGPNATELFAEEWFTMVNAQVGERVETMSVETYERVTEAQSSLFQVMTRLCAAEAGPEADGDEFAAIGRAYYHYRTLLTDIYQYGKTGGEDEWNVVDVLEEDEIVQLVEKWKGKVHERVANLPEENRVPIERMSSADASRWIERHIEDS